MRADIQLLRAFAIACVIAHHAKLQIFAGGYLGVDVFFVISGYLITRSICTAIAGGRFSLMAFYARRFRRLLPPAYVVFFAVAVVSPWILDPHEIEKFMAQLGGALTFSANMVLWRQSGYFDSSADFKPLLHIWSLSLEEQFYFVFPIFLMILPRRLWTPGMAVGFILSCFCCAVLMFYKPNAGFYFLPSRAWELLAGSIVAQLGASSPIISVLRRTTLIAWSGLFLLVLFPISNLHPGWDAVLVCLCTANVLVAARGRAINRYNGWAVRVGNGSYCLYLVHWPLFAWLNNCYLTIPPVELRGAAVVFTAALAWLLRKYVEKPCMQFNGISGNRVFGFAFTLAAVIGIIPVVANRFSSEVTQQMASEIAPVTGLSERCSVDDLFAKLAECRHGENPQVLVWGDSYAMHLVPGLQANAAFGFIQASRVNCSPLMDIAQVNPGTNINLDWAHDCIVYNRRVANFLMHAHDIKVVLVASPFDQNIATPYRPMGSYTVTLNGESTVNSVPDEDQAILALGRTVASIRRSGKRVLLVAPPPRIAENMARCNQRKKIGLPIFGVAADCSISAEAAATYQAPVRTFLHRAEAELDVPVFYVDNFFCPEKICHTQINGNILYRDNGHYSQFGSIRMAESLDFGPAVLALAR